MSTRQEVLELLASGKISATEAADLLEKMKTTKEEEVVAIVNEPAPKKEKDTGSGKDPKWFRIRVKNLETGTNKVSVNLPARMFKFGFNMARRFSSELDDYSWHEISDMMDEEESGIIVDVRDEESNEQVQIYFE